MKPNAHRRVGVAVLAALPVLLLWDGLRLDEVTTRWWADGSGFWARHAFWAEGLLHSGVRLLIGAAVALTLVHILLRPGRGNAHGPTRGELALGLAVALAVSTLVSTLKAHSLTSCPWDLAAFGGQAKWVSHWTWGQGDGGPGHCFPSGHAGGAFALWGLCWPWWRSHRRWALAAFVAVTTLGVAASIGQWARGAHHLSHSLWAAWLCATGLWAAATLKAAWGARKGTHMSRAQPAA